MPRSDTQMRFAILCVEAWLLMPLFAVTLRLAPGLVMRRMRERSVRRSAPANPAAECAAAINRAASALPRRLTTCLPRACAAQLMLARRSANSRLRIGVVKTPTGAVHAHAWVEAEGIDIGLDASSPSFVTLPVSPSS
jgi:Transglutaminase-like superfamily